MRGEFAPAYTKKPILINLIHKKHTQLFISFGYLRDEEKMILDFFGRRVLVNFHHISVMKI